MRKLYWLGACALSLCATLAISSPTFAQSAAPAQQQPGFHGVVTDPSGGSIPGAQVVVRSADGEQKQITNANGEYSFPGLKAGKYEVQVTAPDFKAEDRKDVDVAAATALDVQLQLDVATQTVTVQETAATVSIDPDSNADALVLGKSELDSLSDDPDELSAQLQALAGPGAGPSGGQIYTDGFTGNVPPKSSIREIRINSNPFSAEYDQPGFGRIEILTKPGSDLIHGQFFTQYNNEHFNARSPLYVPSPPPGVSTLPPYKNFFWSGSVGGPIKKDRASFTFDFNHRDITENAFILATALDNSFNPQTINEAVTTPQVFTSLVPRIDLALTPSQTLIARYEDIRSENDNQGIGGTTLPEASYNQTFTSRTIQLTETALLSPALVNETRFQFARTTRFSLNAGTSPAIVVQDAFTGGSARVGTSSNIRNSYELSNLSILNHGSQTMKWGMRLRQSFNHDTSLSNFNGTFTFFGGTGPQLDGNYQPIADTSIDLTGLQVYQRTLLLQRQGQSVAQIRAAGGGASLFSIGAGTPLTTVDQLDLGIFFNNDWKLRSNLTLSYGLRYETQTNIKDHRDWAPRLSIAWGVDGKGSAPAKTVLRLGSGAFYQRISDGSTLNALRYNGVTQQSYLLSNPDFFPTLPSLASLAAGVQPQTIQLLAGNIEAPQLYFLNAGVDRQINKYVRLSLNYYGTKGVHMQRTRDANAPLPGTAIYPYGDPTVRMLSESSGSMKQQSIQINPNVNYKKLSLFGFIGASWSHADFDSLPADPYNLRAEWAPAFGDVRYRAYFGPTFPLPFRITANTLLFYNSGSVYNITTGAADPDGDGGAVQRPALLNLPASGCGGTNLKYVAQFGCFDLFPAAGTATIGRNSARGPGNIQTQIRIARTFGFVRKEGPAGAGPMGPGGPGGPMMGPMGGPPQGMPIPMKYNLTVSVQALNPINHPNFANPNGNLLSPFFGQSQYLQGGFGLPGSEPFERKIILQTQFSF